MVVIRLQRGGANKRPFYHLVVADSRRAASGKFLERLGFYDPKAPQGREALRVNLCRSVRNSALCSPSIASAGRCRIRSTICAGASVHPNWI